MTNMFFFFQLFNIFNKYAPIEAYFPDYMLHPFQVIFRNFNNLCHHHHSSIWSLFITLIRSLTYFHHSYSLPETVIILLFLSICLFWAFYINKPTQYVSNFSMHRNHIKMQIEKVSSEALKSVVLTR